MTTNRSPYRADLRSPAEVEAQLARIARRLALPPTLADPDEGLHTWADLLFDGDRVRDPREPSQALLRTLAHLHSGLAEHFDETPGRFLEWYLEDRLGLRPLDPVPDRVVLAAEGDPHRLPSALPPGARVLAGKNRFGEDREYWTEEPLAVLGARPVGAHSVLGEATRDRIRRRVAEEGDLPLPFHPFAIGEENEPAPHELYFASPLLRHDDRDEARLQVELGFAGLSSGAKALLESLVWEVSTSEGPVACGVEEISGPELRARLETVSGSRVVLRITPPGAVAPDPTSGIEDPWVRVRTPLPEEGSTLPSSPFDFRFRKAVLRVLGRKLSPEAGFHNGGMLDLEKEFEPFGPVPRRGDSFYLACDEALGKPLHSLSVDIEVHAAPSPGAGITLKPAHYELVQAAELEYAFDSSLLMTLMHVEDPEALPPTVHALAMYSPKGASSPTLRWQRRTQGSWETIASSGKLSSLPSTPLPGSTEGAGGRAASRPTVVGRREGHFIRVLLDEGDFGWKAYERTAQRNAYHAARGEHSQVVENPVPDPPIVSRIRVDYATAAASSSSSGTLLGLRVLTRNGLGLPHHEGAIGGEDSECFPFRRSLSEDTGRFYLGLDRSHPGERMSLYFAVEEATVCEGGGAGAGTAPDWRYRRSEGGWAPLEVDDRTEGLRISGLVRFVAPSDWAEGAPEGGELRGFWIRVESSAPRRIGAVRALIPDAVEAVYRPSPGREEVDDTPSEPLGALEVTGLRVPLPGIKEVSNPAPSRGGRGPEGRPSFLTRAGGELRHRGRGISAWDLEELVRTRFPEVGLVRALPHHSEESDCAPGHVGLVILPDANRSDPSARERRPHPGLHLAARIRSFLTSRVPMHMEIQVLCPRFLEVGVRVDFTARAELTAAQAREELNRSLRHFLHPLARKERGTDPSGGVFRSELLRMVRDHPAVADIALLRFLGDAAPLEELRPDDPCRGFLASVANHDLRPEVPA